MMGLVLCSFPPQSFLPLQSRLLSPLCFSFCCISLSSWKPEYSQLTLPTPCSLGVTRHKSLSSIPAEPCGVDASWGTQPAPCMSWPHSLGSSCFGTSLGSTASPKLFPAAETAAPAEVFPLAQVQLLHVLISYNLKYTVSLDAFPGCLARVVAITQEAKHPWALCPPVLLSGGCLHRLGCAGEAMEAQQRISMRKSIPESLLTHLSSKGNLPSGKTGPQGD